jgi:hypothetical protein
MNCEILNANEPTMLYDLVIGRDPDAAIDIFGHCANAA